MSSIKKNFLYDSILTVSGYIFTLVTFPYVSRVLGVTNIGICNFVDSVINYFILFSMLGVSTIGIREIAKKKNDKLELERSFSNIILINAIFTFIALIILVALIFIIPDFYKHKELMLIGAFKLIFNFFLVEWFYKGLEDFRYITVRNIAIRIGYVISVFLFVKETGDYSLYYFLTTLTIVINALINVFHLKSHIRIRMNFNRNNLKKYLSPIIILGLYGLLASMYTSFNIVYLGFIQGEKEVGYYTTAIKLYSILFALFAALTRVMLPRMSSLLSSGNLNEFGKMTNKSYDILLSFSIPLIIFSIILAPDIIFFLAGEGYEGAILPMQIIMPLMLLAGYEQILTMQILTPLQKDKAIFINSLLGAVVGISLNIVLVPLYKSVGSALAWFISEIIILIFAQYFVYKYVKFLFSYKRLLLHLSLAFPAIFGALLIIRMKSFAPLINILLIGGFLVCYYTIVQLKILKNEYFVRIMKKFVLRKNNDL
jgi:O-antigen/teichoic acid export membrane protein